MVARRILLTGANRGIALELARQLIGQGHQVWGTARQAEPEAFLALEPAGAVQLDLASEDSIVAALAAVAEQTNALDILVNCAGIDCRELGSPEAPRGIFDVPADIVNELNRINITGPLVTTREALPLLRQGTDPVVLNFSSQLGSMQVASRKGRDAPYCVSKAGLNMVTVKAAAALRDEGIAVVALHPGWVSSDMGGTHAPMTPVESATTIASTLTALTMADSGRFIRWDGSDHPW